MYTTQLLMQLAGAASAMWELPVVSTGKNPAQDTGTSFQDLLQQRQEQTTQGSTGTQEEGTVSQKPAENTGTEDQETKAPQTMGMDLAAMGAALLMDGFHQIQPEMAVTVQPQEQAVVLEGISPEMAVAGDVVAASSAPVLTQEQAPAPQIQTAQPASTAVQDAPAAEIATQVQAPAEPVQQENSASTEDGGFTAFQNGQTVRQEDAPQVTDMAGSWETPLFSQTEQMPVKVGDTVTVDTTAPAPEMEQTLGKILNSGLEDGAQRLEIQLSPANLGTVTAEFIQSPEGALHVVLRAETPEAAKLLSDHAGTLGLLLQDGTRGEVRVEVPQPQQNQQLWQQPDQEGGRQQQQQQQQQQQTPRQETETFLHQLRLGLVETGLAENL